MVGRQLLVLPLEEVSEVGEVIVTSVSELVVVAPGLLVRRALVHLVSY